MFGFLRNIRKALEDPNDLESEVRRLENLLRYACSHPIEFVEIKESDNVEERQRYCKSCKQHIGPLNEKEAIIEKIDKKQTYVEEIREGREELLAKMRKLDGDETRTQLELEKLWKELRELE